MSNIQTSNITFNDIRTLLNANGGAVTNNVSTAFTNGNINKWAKNKPVRNSSIIMLDDAGYSSSDEGMQLGNLIVQPGAVGPPVEMSYLQPRGGRYNEPYRLADFRGYDSDQKNWWTMSVKNGTDKLYNDKEYWNIAADSAEIEWSNGDWLTMLRNCSTMANAGMASFGFMLFGRDWRVTDGWNNVLGYYNAGTLSDAGGSYYSVPLRGGNLINDLTICTLVPCASTMPSDIGNRHYGVWFGPCADTDMLPDWSVFSYMMLKGERDLNVWVRGRAWELMNNIRFNLNCSASSPNASESSTTAVFSGNCDVWNDNATSVMIRAIVSRSGAVIADTETYQQIEGNGSLFGIANGSDTWTSDSAIVEAHLYCDFGDYGKGEMHALWNSKTSNGGAGYGTVSGTIVDR